MYTHWAMQAMMIHQQQERLEAAARRRASWARGPARRRRARWSTDLRLPVVLRPSPPAPITSAGPSGAGGCG